MQDDRPFLHDGDPDRIEGAVIGRVGVLNSMHEAYPHAHSKAQLLHVISGAITVEVESGVWTVPPGCAIWIPGGATHSARFVGQISMAILHLSPEVEAALKIECSIIFVPPLLRELILRFARGGGFEQTKEREDRLIGVLIDELACAPEEPLHLPLPTDRRLRRIALAMLEDPAQRLTIDEWGARVGASNRTLSRLFREETGMPFSTWRQQLHVGIALQKLATGVSVTNVALDLGYQNVGTFISMFKRMMGVSPTRYFGQQQDAGPDSGAALKSGSSAEVVAIDRARAGRSR